MPALALMFSTVKDAALPIDKASPAPVVGMGIAAKLFVGIVPTAASIAAPALPVTRMVEDAARATVESMFPVVACDTSVVAGVHAVGESFVNAWTDALAPVTPVDILHRI